ncbi:MAG: glycoside hydrolase family 3 domain protein [Amycolatopsis sp.]|uniref:glycoside hydrolase family 3 N-terminal domain-containing protein n=1 Tax=Amycolatopsis sp. TaxID=37632 RepID=UPI00260ABB1E|nr:glycoside hydrolase family 3 N-terminal domain-containing protein [Amycolatopsis sp.]MCU1687431.1 glycoside hydrolase family 3 domain protein [Amycolatopsis sp.]
MSEADTRTPLQRADALLARMTVEEKVRQRGCCFPLTLLGHDSELDEPALHQRLSQGIGHVAPLTLYGYKPPAVAARLAGQIQRFLVENTRLGIPAIFHNEGLNGVLAPQCTVFPTAIGLAATWNPDAVRRLAGVVARAMRAIGQHQALSPVMDVARDARWGRVHETYGEDPYLVSAFSVAYVQGLQGEDLTEGVLATGKHFLGYAAGEGGLNLAGTRIGARELYEVYARPFEAAIHLAGLGSVMNSYAEVDGIPAGASRAVLTGLLRERLGFTGTVVSDYGTIPMLVDRQHVARDTTEAAILALTAGLDVELPTTVGYGSAFADAVTADRVATDALDDAVRRVLHDKFALGLFERPYPCEDPIVITRTARDGADLAAELARQSITLLANDHGLLPLSRDITRIAIVGPHADDVTGAFGAYTYPGSVAMMRALAAGQGATMQGLDSSDDFLSPGALTAIGRELRPVLAQTPGDWIRADYPTCSLADAIRALAPTATVTVVPGAGVLDDEPGDIRAAVAAARDADVVIAALGGRCGWFHGPLTEGEGIDTADIDLPACQVELVTAVAATGTPVVGVVHTGRPMALTGIGEHVAALVWAAYGGQEQAAAMADVLFGVVNPGGKLPYSIPRHSGQVPIHHAQQANSGYRGAGYRDMPSTPLFAFGHGHSYTTFGYTDLTVSPQSVDTDGTLTISVQVTNTGDVAGDEVVQLYVHDDATGVVRPAQELAGFHRLCLAPGAARQVRFTLPLTQLGYLDPAGRFVLEPGPIQVMVGAASDDIRGTATVEITGPFRELTGHRTYLGIATAVPVPEGAKA